MISLWEIKKNKISPGVDQRLVVYQHLAPRQMYISSFATLFPIFLLYLVEKDEEVVKTLKKMILTCEVPVPGSFSFNDLFSLKLFSAQGNILK